jgi:hypothetical protein
MTDVSNIDLFSGHPPYRLKMRPSLKAAALNAHSQAVLSSLPSLDADRYATLNVIDFFETAGRHS